jgi:PleD family two-component response regulator
VLEDLRLDLNGSVTQVAFDVGQYELGRSVTASIGFVTVTIDKTDPRSAQDITYDLIDIADKRMHFAKEHGKNRVVGSKQETQQTQQP